MGLHPNASAALVFLILYAILFVFLLWGSLTGRLSLRSRYSLILFYVVVRLACQAAGLAFGIVGSANISLLVAYFILGAEGYYVLVLCIHCFLVWWQDHNPASDSWLQSRFASGTSWYKRLIQYFIVVDSNCRPTFLLVWLLNCANALVFSGGTMLPGGKNNPQHFNRNLPAAKGLRTAGLAGLLTMNIILLYCVVDTIRQSRHENPGKRTHPTLLLLLATCLLLFVRGVYGVVSGILPAFNYFNPSNYGERGFHSSFVISECIMGTAMEWGGCMLLMLTHFTSLPHDPQTADSEVYHEAKKISQSEQVKHKV